MTRREPTTGAPPQRDAEVGSHRAPRVSVVVSMYNAERYVAEAIDSVLRQSFAEWELLIVDDGSSDGSTVIAQRYAAAHPYRIRYLTHSGRANRGVSASRNLGAAHAHGEFIAVLDADDACEPLRLEEQVRFLDAHPEIALVGSHFVEIDDGGAARRGIDLPLSHREICWHLLFNNAFIHSSVMFRRSDVLASAGGYNETIAYAHDYEYWLRITAGLRVANLPAALVRYRVHDASLSARFINRADEMPALRAERHARMLGWDASDPDIRARSDATAAVALGWDDPIAGDVLVRAAGDVLRLHTVFCKEQNLFKEEALSNEAEVRSRIARHLVLVAAARSLKSPKEALRLWRCAHRAAPSVALHWRTVLKGCGRAAASVGIRVHLPGRPASAA
jgi:glycosyltransferase involved in cell wall biosynthesis